MNLLLRVSRFLGVLGVMLSLPCVLIAGSPKAVYTCDLRGLNRLDLHKATNAVQVWDTVHAISALQGIVNREAPQLYLFYCNEFGVDTDQFWFDWFRGEDGWLGGSEIRKLEGLREAVDAFRPAIKGLVVYDSGVPATSNLGSTAAGCDDLIPVRFDPTPGSVYTLLAKEMKLPVKLWLVHPGGTPMFTGKGMIFDVGEPSSGSAKVDCYRWAEKRYLSRCSPGIGAYYVDSFWLQNPLRGDPTLHTLSNHDYYIARRAFFFDLSPWGDELPNDDLTAPLGVDKQEFLRIMRGLYDLSQGGMIQVGGFTPWPFKYTTESKPACKHGGVETEWEHARLISQFNGYMEADAAGLSAMANASFYRHYPLPERMAQPNAKPGLDQWRARGYVDGQGKVAAKLFVGHYAGDYDSPAWLYKAVPKFFRDPERGKVPVGWAFDPNLADRAPQAMMYAYRHATTNDFFISGDSGAGYLNPRALTVRPDSKLPSGLDKWREHCRKYYDRWGMSITGFIIDGAAGGSTETEFAAYRNFSPDGAGTHYERGPAIHSGMPTCPEHDLPDDAGEAAKRIAEAARGLKGQPGFYWARSILKTPAWYVEVSRQLTAKYPDAAVEVVDPYTFFGLVQLQLGRTAEKK